MTHAGNGAMGAKQYQDLVVWQIAEELRCEVYRLTQDGAVSRDFRFRDQLRQAAGGVSTNIAEGFRRLGAREFIQFLRYAYASAGETAEWLEDGVARKHWKNDEVAGARRILGRLNPPLLALIRYLRTPEAQSRSRAIKIRATPEPSTSSKKPGDPE
jgi:four helix bundle protein